MRKSYVYKITCKITGEYYFGSSFNAKSDRYWGSGRKIKERISLYGKENFVKEILGEFYDRVEANKKENKYIEQFRHDNKCLNERIEYHFRSFSEETRAKIGAANAISQRGKHLSEETRAKIGAANAISQRGKQFSDEHRAKIGAAKRGEHLSEEHKAKLSAAHRGKHLSEETRAKLGAATRGDKNPMFGKHHTEETRAKLSAAHRGKHWRKNPVTGKREWYD